MTKTPATKPALPQPAAAKAPAAQSPAPAARLTLAAVMGLLEQLGSEQTRKTWVRHGAQGPMFGVLFGELFKLMKRIGVDHELARALWATGNVDARNLAMKIADPLAMTSDELDRWALEYEMGMCGLYIASLAAEGPHGAAKVREWLSSPHERLRGEGWTLLGRLSDLDETFSEAELRRRVAEIEQTIHAAPNVTRSKMNQALIAIGGHSPALREAVLAAAKRIGPVTVDHGDTSCKTPNAVEYVAKMWERAGKKYPSPAAHQRSLGSMRRRC
ncbi:MAG: DNA alkylation repair protein [Verrucomicrobia bacterium]|nr:DNA alkylation repair protein [Verrucomicrobiota bacterium]